MNPPSFAAEPVSTRQVVGFALLSPQSAPMPSTRIACLNLFPHLRDRGFDPVVCWEPAEATEIPAHVATEPLLAHSPSVVVFQKIRGPAVVDAVRALRARGIATVWSVCDIVDDEMASETDATVAVTPFLRSLYLPALQHKIHVVHDGIEDAALVAATVARPLRRPTAVMVTSDELNALPLIVGAPRGWHIDVLGRYPASALERSRHVLWALRTKSPADALLTIRSLCDPAVRRRPWSREAVSAALRTAQAGIIPIDRSAGTLAYGSREPEWRVKSENRLTLMMAAGLPVIATPIPAYEDVIDDGRNGFFANTPKDWAELFRRLRDADLRREVGRRAREDALARYSIQRQADRLVNVLRETLRTPSAASGR